MERKEKEVGRFGINISIFQNVNGNIISEFSNRNINVTPEIIITQLRTFIKRLEDNYNSNFKDNSIDISGSPEE